MGLTSCQIQYPGLDCTSGLIRHKSSKLQHPLPLDLATCQVQLSIGLAIFSTHRPWAWLCAKPKLAWVFHVVMLNILEFNYILKPNRLEYGKLSGSGPLSLVAHRAQLGMSLTDSQIYLPQALQCIKNKWLKAWRSLQVHVVYVLEYMINQ